MISNNNKMTMRKIKMKRIKRMKIRIKIRMKMKIRMANSKIRTNKIIKKKVPRSYPPSSQFKHNNSNSKA